MTPLAAVGQSGSAVELSAIEKKFSTSGQPVVALSGINLSVPSGGFTSIVGPSGCGKSTILRILAGLSAPTSGQTLCNGAEVTGVNTNVGYVSQGSYLFPWMTLRQNVAFPLEARKVPADEAADRVARYIEMVGLAGFEDSYPYQLSGGMQKRASIIRTLVYEPDIILMDEPFGALDAQTKLIMQDELLRLWSGNERCIIFVTHDLNEAIALSDTLVVMTRRPGRIKSIFDIDIPRPRDVFDIQAAPGFVEIHQRVWADLKSEVFALKNQ